MEHTISTRLINVLHCTRSAVFVPTSERNVAPVQCALRNAATVQCAIMCEINIEYQNVKKCKRKKTKKV